MPAFADAFKGLQVPIDCINAMVGFPSNDGGFFAFAIPFQANNPLVGQAGPHIVEGGPSRDGRLLLPLIGCQELGNPPLGRMEEQREVTIGEHGLLGMCLLTEPRDSSGGSAARPPCSSFAP